jgi:hypothetical protein
MREKSYIFAAIHAKNHIGINSSSYFYGYTIAALSKDKRLSNPCRLLHLCRNDSWRNMGGDSLLSFIYFNFHRQMPRINENASMVKNSSRTRTPNSAKTVSFKKFQIEKNAKNQAYYFILSNGLLDRFKEFCNNYHSDDPHADCVRSLLSKNL